MKKLILWTVFAASVSILVQCSSGNKPQDTQSETTDVSSVRKIIVDVRTPAEWQNDGHADCSVNYPLDEFESHIDSLKTYVEVVLVCRSGNRAGIAKEMLEAAGYTNAENLGAWQNIECAE